jgi:hypothetical protein
VLLPARLFDQAGSAEFKTNTKAVTQEQGLLGAKTRRSLTWAMPHANHVCLAAHTSKRKESGE